jgi:hypothetical protein
VNLSEDTIERLKDIVRKATVLVFVNGRAVGAAFFISDDLLLTCNHVADQQDAVEIQHLGRERRHVEVIDTDPVDLALLRCHRLQGERAPCAVLGRRLEGRDCFVAGFPREDGQPSGQEVFDVEAHPRTDPDRRRGRRAVAADRGRQDHHLRDERRPGRQRPMAVIGIILSSKNPDDNLGGGAVPMARAAKAFPQVAQLLEKSTMAMGEWRDVLGRDHWQWLGRSWSSVEECIDLQVAGKLDCWQISLDQTAGPPQDRTAANLGNDVAEALFLWAQRRHVRGSEEVGKVAPLLARALFPKEIEDHLHSVSQANSVLVRLHVERGNVLADIPWELSAVPGEKEYLAAAAKYRFVRVVDGRTLPARPKASVSVLGVVVRPSNWQYPSTQGRDGNQSSDSPDSPDLRNLRNALRNSVENNDFKFDLCESAQPAEVIEALKRRPYDVLHYLGSGREENDGAAIVFVDSAGRESWASADSTRAILDTAQKNGVRVVVLELMLPPEQQRYKPLTCRVLDVPIKDSVSAVVLTNLPVQPEQCHQFNGKFYQVLKKGKSVEEAVQQARDTLQCNTPEGDAAGFGCFTIVTGPQSNIHLVSPPPEDPTESGVRQPSQLGGSAAFMDASLANESVAGRTGHAFHC